MGFAQLAKQISAYTTKCLLTCLVLVAGLGLGRQVLVWWKAEPTGPAALPGAESAGGLGDLGHLHILQFGDQSWSIRRQSIPGSKAEAVKALQARCREVVAAESLPAACQEVAAKAAAEKDAEFLARLAQTKPVEEQAGRWALYQLNAELPMMAGVKVVSVGGKAAPGTILANPSPCVVTWGLAIPFGSQGWTLYTFQPERPSGGWSDSLPELSLPPDCRRTMLMRTVEGAGMLSFEGPPQPETWMRFYDQWFQKHRWRAEGWQHVGGGWQARFHAPQDRPGTADLWLGPGRPGRMAGLAMISQQK